jgi:ribosomal protein S13
MAVMDSHTGLSHDLPEYVPNTLPLAADLRRQVRSKVKVFKMSAYWGWRHDCGHQVMGQTCFDSQPMALNWALHHLKGCR